MNVLVISHGPEITPGWLDDACRQADATLIRLDFSRGDALPGERSDKVIVLGGHMGAYEDETYPWLSVEKALLRSVLAADTPLLGVCLGSQLLAEVIGGKARRAPTTEIGLLQVDRTAAGRTDSTLAAISGPVVVWHQDTFDLPAGTDVLAATPDYPHAFRYGSALGVQFHPEVTPPMWDDWIGVAGTEDLVHAGLDPDLFRTSLRKQAGRLREQAVAFFTAWLDE